MTHQPLDEWAARARAWLAERLRPRAHAGGWGEGSDDVAVFHSLTHDEEGALLEAIRGWQREKFDAGYGAITWPVEYGGAGLSGTYARAFRRPLLSAEILACQLFSAPGLSCSAVRDADGWVLNGQKVWSSEAQFSQLGEIICRTDRTVPKHRGLTAFLLPMDTSGVEAGPSAR